MIRPMTCAPPPSAGWVGMVRYMVFFVIELKSRAVEIAGIAVDPASDQPFVMSCKITTNR